MDQYSNYDLTEDDPYLIPGSQCLENLLGFTDTPALNDAEEQLTQITMAELARNPPDATFNFEHLKEIHRRIFEDVYPFAGQPRIMDILKGGKLFLPHRMIAEVAQDTFSELHAENRLQGLSPGDFGTRAGYYLGKINMIHPFREGNGRTQRVLLNQLAELNGYAIEWAAISGEAMVLACRAARMDEPDYWPLQRLLSLNTVDHER